MIKFRVWDKEENKMHKVKTIEFSRRGARIIHLAEVNSNGKGDHKRTVSKFMKGILLKLKMEAMDLLKSLLSKEIIAMEVFTL